MERLKLPSERPRPSRGGSLGATRHQGQSSGRVVLGWAEGQRVAMKLCSGEDIFSDRGPPTIGGIISVWRWVVGSGGRIYAGWVVETPFQEENQEQCWFLISDRETRCRSVDSEPG
jgi:hypothetical protein